MRDALSFFSRRLTEMTANDFFTRRIVATGFAWLYLELEALPQRAYHLGRVLEAARGLLSRSSANSFSTSVVSRCLADAGGVQFAVAMLRHEVAARNRLPFVGSDYPCESISIIQMLSRSAAARRALGTKTIGSEGWWPPVEDMCGVELLLELATCLHNTPHVAALSCLSELVEEGREALLDGGGGSFGVLPRLLRVLPFLRVLGATGATTTDPVVSLIGGLCDETIAQDLASSLNHHLDAPGLITTSSTICSARDMHLSFGQCVKVLACIMISSCNPNRRCESTYIEALNEAEAARALVFALTSPIHDHHDLAQRAICAMLRGPMRRPTIDAILLGLQDGRHLRCHTSALCNSLLEPGFVQKIWQCQCHRSLSDALARGQLSEHLETVEVLGKLAGDAWRAVDILTWLDDHHHQILWLMRLYQASAAVRACATVPHFSSMPWPRLLPRPSLCCRCAHVSRSRGRRSCCIALLPSPSVQSTRLVTIDHS